MPFGTGGFDKQINVVVGGNASGYIRQMGLASSATKAFKMGLAVAGAAVVSFSAVMITKAVKAAAEFELGMAKVKAISGATEEEFKLLTAEAERLGLVTAQSMTDIALGMEEFSRAGFSATETISAMSGAVALAESQVMELGSAVEITASVLNGMRLPAEESERVVNALAAAASSSATTVDTLGESMKYLAPVASDLSIPLEEALAAVGKLGDAGLQGGIATRAFSTALLGLASPTEEAADMMGQLGIDLFDTSGDFVGITGLVNQFETALVGMTAEERAAALGAIFTGGAVKSFSILLGVGSDELEAYQEELTGTTVAFDQQAAMLDTLEGQWTILKGSVSALFVALGTSLMPMLKDFLHDRIIPIINATIEWVKSMGGISGMIGHVMIAVGNYINAAADWIESNEFVRIAIEGVWSILKDLWSFVVNVFRRDWAAAWEDIKSITKTVLETIKGVVMAVWDALPIPDSIKKKIESVFMSIKNVAVASWEGIKASAEENMPGIVAAWEEVKDSAASLWESVQSVFSSIMGLFGETEIDAVSFGDVVGGVFDILFIVVETALNGIANLFDIISSLLRGDWQQAWKDFKNFIGGIWESILNILDVVGLRDNLSAAWEYIRQDAVAKWTAIGDFFGNIWDSITGAFKAAIDWVKSIVPGFIRNWLGWGEESADAYKTGIEDGQAGVEEAATNLAMAAVEAIAQTIEEVEDTAKELTSSFVGMLTDAEPDAEDAGFGIGTASADGIIGGIESMFTPLEGAGVDAMNNVLDGISITGGIQSPSTVTTEMGEDTALGLIAGMRNQAAKLIAAGEAMITQATDPLKAGPEIAAAAGEQTAAAYAESVIGTMGERETDLDYAGKQTTDALVDAVVGTMGERETDLDYAVARGTKVITDGVEDMADEVVEEVETMWGQIIKTTREDAMDWADEISSVLSGIKGDITSFLSDIIKDVASGTKTLGQAVLDGVTAIGTSILNSGIDMAAKWAVDQLWRIVFGANDAMAALSTATQTIGAAVSSAGGAAAGGAAAGGAAAGGGTSLGTVATVFAAPLLYGAIDPEVTHQFGQQLDDVARTIFSPILDLLDRITGTGAHRDTGGSIQVPAYHHGGILPGAIGRPQLFMGLGGEEIRTRAQQQQNQGGATAVIVQNHIYLSGEEVTDLVTESIRHESKFLTGRKTTAAGLTRRAR